jgi:hypothetical protein
MFFQEVNPLVTGVAITGVIIVFLFLVATYNLIKKRGAL